MAIRLLGLRSRRGLGAGDFAGVFFGFFVDAGVFFGVLLLAGLFAARFGDGAGDDFGVAAFGEPAPPPAPVSPASPRRLLG